MQNNQNDIYRSEMIIDIVKALYNDPLIILRMIMVFLISTFALSICLVVPLSLLEGPTLYLLRDLWGLNWTSGDVRFTMASGIAFWIGFFWCAKKTNPNYFRERWHYLSKKDG